MGGKTIVISFLLILPEFCALCILKTKISIISPSVFPPRNPAFLTTRSPLASHITVGISAHPHRGFSTLLYDGLQLHPLVHQHSMSCPLGFPSSLAATDSAPETSLTQLGPAPFPWRSPSRLLRAAAAGHRQLQPRVSQRAWLLHKETSFMKADPGGLVANVLL